MLRRVAGIFLVATLKVLGRLPTRVVVLFGLPFLSGYACFRPAKIRLRSLRRHAIFPVPSTGSYYRMRLQLGWLSLRQLLGKPDPFPAVKGEAHYRQALQTGHPVALVGWHLGPVEWLHRLPPMPENGKSFRIMTAGAFTPALTQLLMKGRQQLGKKIIANNRAAFEMKAWVLDRGVLAVMIDQAPGEPTRYWDLWQGTVRLPCPESLWNFFTRHDVIVVPVEAKLLPDRTILFQYHPGIAADPGENALAKMREVLENSIASAPDQFNWSYPKIRVNEIPSAPVSRPHRV